MYCRDSPKAEPHEGFRVEKFLPLSPWLKHLRLSDLAFAVESAKTDYKFGLTPKGMGTALFATLRETIRRSNNMATMDEVKGRAKKAAGDLTGNDKLKREGKADQAAGKVKDAVDTVAEKAKDAIRKKS
jgi:uncharacterized protein YjbJ (UPF0337 family)